MNMQLLIYTPENTPRLKYSFALFFEHIISVPYRITNDKEEYANWQGPKLNYSSGITEKDPFSINPSSLLFQSGISPQKISISEWNGLKIFFPSASGNLPFDIFSAAFYLVSRYEEYFDRPLDCHARFQAVSSLAYQNQFLEQPLVNLWAMQLKKELLKQFPMLAFKEAVYTYTPTIDIDVAYAHLGRTAAVTAGGYLRMLLKLNTKGILEKTAVLLGTKQDPYDTYSYQEAVIKKYKLSPIYFFLASSIRSHYDRNINPGGKTFAALVKKASGFAQIGIHPSYQSASRAEVVNAEVANVERCLTYKITKSRQHFLRVRLPETYRCLAELNITDDYSLAYAQAPGFRASICTPFPFYDLRAEKTLPVTVHPPAVMDGTLNEYMNMSPGDAEKAIERIIAQVKYCRGEFISIWHNHSLSERDNWENWKEVFENMVKWAAS